MKTLLIIVIAIVLLIWAAVDFVWCRSLTEREKKIKNQREQLRLTEIAHLRQAEAYNREKEGLKERELNLAARKESILELEATLLNKQTWLAGEESRLKDVEESLHDQKRELDGKADYYALMEKAYNELKAEKEAKKAKKKCQDKKGQ